MDRVTEVVEGGGGGDAEEEVLGAVGEDEVAGGGAVHEREVLERLVRGLLEVQALGQGAVGGPGEEAVAVEVVDALMRGVGGDVRGSSHHSHRSH
ncbi:hypothetical protein GCM10009601_36980 [Streptomyces thermospinosisporus]|uniref:Uncharacterized protein n=1 Tax=Streptomyces thermospinosisporus TaxID=161482 RepID=A0ABN1Z259_9ACTN